MKHWYYLEGREPRGPVSEADFAGLVAAGRIGPETLVWHSGLSGWQPHGAVEARNGKTAAPPVHAAPPAAAIPPVASDAARELRPMSIGDILDRTFRLYRKHFMPFFLVMFPIQAVTYLSQLVWQVAIFSRFQGRPEPQALAGTVIAGGLLFFAGMTLIIILTQIGIGTLTAAVSADFLGEEVSLRGAYRRVRERLGSLLGAVFLSSLWVGLGLILCLIPGIYLLLSYLLVSQVVILEKLGAGAALRRSKELMRIKSEKGFLHNNINRASVILLVTFVLSGVVGGMVGLVFGIFMVLTRQIDPNPLAAINLVQGVLTMMVRAAVAPVGPIAMVLFYYDIRIRKEGFDLEILAAAMAGRTPSAGSPPGA